LTIAHDHRCKALEWFIQKDNLRIANQRARDGEHLLLAAG
jgi:hypothetical protein